MHKIGEVAIEDTMCAKLANARKRRVKSVKLHFQLPRRNQPCTFQAAGMPGKCTQSLQDADSCPTANGNS
jgi:hypothetical protein